MSPMPMQPKIGEASLKFGPDWLRALSSSENPGNGPRSASSAPPGSGDAGSVPRDSHRGFSYGFNAWQGNNISSSGDRDNQTSHHPSFRNKENSQYLNSPRDKERPDRRYKPSEYRYSREEMLALYDKNLNAPAFLLKLENLFIEKMQPPLAFSQPSEDEIRIWHSPQPESSRQGVGTAPIGRGFAVRGRGGGIDRGRGRGGRGGYYGRSHEDEDRAPFSRPRNFERSQSNHERISWSERNGVGGPGLTEDANRGGGGNWRSRDFGGNMRRHGDENDDGWRKPRWRREDDDELHRSNSRRLNRSWSEDDNHDIPEWARDNPSEESGTFDASGAFHGDDRSRIREADKPSADGLKSDPSGSHGSDREREVQKRVQDKSDTVKPVIPEEEEALSISQPSQTTSVISNSITKHQKHPNESVGPIDENQDFLKQPSIDKPYDNQDIPSHPTATVLSSNIIQQQLHQKVSASSTGIVTSTSIIKQQQMHSDLKSSDNVNITNRPTDVKNTNLPVQNEEEHYRSMTEEAMNLVSRLIEEDASGTRATAAAMAAGLKLPGGGNLNMGVTPSQQIISNVSNMVEPSSSNPAAMGGLTEIPGRPPIASPFEIWYYRDPQGSVQGPFTTHEMGLWCSQGYFSGSLFLRRECDKIFITLAEMGKLYNRNPFSVNAEAPPPPPVQDLSALEFSRGDNAMQAQIQQRQQQILQQNLLREQYLLNVARKDDSSWQPTNIPQSISSSVAGRTSTSTAPSQMGPDPIPAQLLLNMAKAQGIEREPNALDQLQALFQRQLKVADPAMMAQNQKNNYPEMMPNNRHGAPVEVSKSPAPVPDPIQSLVQQLTSMTNTQQMKMNPINKPDPVSPWGASPIQNTPSSHWSSHNNPTSTPWEFRDQVALNQKMQHEEELRRRQEEEECERKRLEEEERKRAEEQQRAEIEREQRQRMEEQQRLEEEKQRKIREQQEYMIQQQKQQEILRKQQEEEMRQKEMLQRQLEQQQRQKLEQQRQLRDEQTRIAEEQQRLENERKEKEQAEKMRQEKEAQKFPWSEVQTPVAFPPAKSILEIQQEEAIEYEKDVADKKKAKSMEALRQQQQQAQHQKAINLKWAQNPPVPAKTPIKSLTEIQAEEQAKLLKQQEKEREKRAAIQQQHQQQQAWSAQLTWANRASVGPATGKKVNGGVWEDAASKLKANSSSASGNGGNSNNRPQVSSQSSAASKKTKEMSEESFMKLFTVQDGEKNKAQRKGQEGTGAQDEFTRWCFEKLPQLGGNVDIKTFINFLKEVESPYEVSDYVRTYIGDSKDAREFSREFLERRSRWKNSRKDAAEDNLCRPASAVNPNSNEFQEVKPKGKKTKKGKMQKVDSRILGFSTSAAADRVNVGNRDYGDSTD